MSYKSSSKYSDSKHSDSKYSDSKYSDSKPSTSDKTKSRSRHLDDSDNEDESSSKYERVKSTKKSDKDVTEPDSKSTKVTKVSTPSVTPSMIKKLASLIPAYSRLKELYVNTYNTLVTNKRSALTKAHMLNVISPAVSDLYDTWLDKHPNSSDSERKAQKAKITQLVKASNVMADRGKDFLTSYGAAFVSSTLRKLSRDELAVVRNAVVTHRLKNLLKEASTYQSSVSEKLEKFTKAWDKDHPKADKKLPARLNAIKAERERLNLLEKPDKERFKKEMSDHNSAVYMAKVDYDVLRGEYTHYRDYDAAVSSFVPKYDISGDDPTHTEIQAALSQGYGTPDTSFVDLFSQILEMSLGYCVLRHVNTLAAKDSSTFPIDVSSITPKPEKQHISAYKKLVPYVLDKGYKYITTHMRDLLPSGVKPKDFDNSDLVTVIYSLLSPLVLKMLSYEIKSIHTVRNRYALKLRRCDLMHAMHTLVAQGSDLTSEDVIEFYKVVIKSCAIPGVDSPAAFPGSFVEYLVDKSGRGTSKSHRKSSRKSHDDSDVEEKPKRKSRSEDKPSRRKSHDDSDDEDKPRRKSRDDSDDDSDVEEKPKRKSRSEDKPSRRKSHDDSDDEEKPIRKSHDDSDVEDKPSRRKSHADSDDDSDAEEKPSRRKSHDDSDDEEKPSRRKRRDDFDM